MRVTGGRLKGRQLISFNQGHIRPTTDQIKQSIFNILGQSLEGLRVLDLYSGTGSLAIEAVSRGAREVYAVEKHPASLKVIQKNLRTLAIEDEIEVISSDVIAFLQGFKAEPFDLIMIDPPFKLELAQPTMEALVKSQVWAEHTVITLEYSPFEPMQESFDPLLRIDFRKYGDKCLAFFKARA